MKILLRYSEKSILILESLATPIQMLADCLTQMVVLRLPQFGQGMLKSGMHMHPAFALMPKSLNWL
jgi:hypothetical protein